MAEEEKKRTARVSRRPVRTLVGTVQERDMRMDNVKGVSILLVVVGHFLLPLYRTRLITGIFYAIYSFHMPLFCMASGYFSKGIYRDGRLRADRVLNTLWLYIVYELIVNITEGLLEGHIGMPDLLHESGAPWYLLALFFWYLMLPLFSRMKKYPVLSAAGLTGLVILIKYLWDPGDFLALDRVLSFSVFFFAGYVCTQDIITRFLRSGFRRVAIISAFVLLAFVFLSTYDVLMRYHLVVYGADFGRYDPSLRGSIWLINLIWYTGAFLICAGVTGAMLNRPMAVITKLGKNTLQIYILHRPLRDLLQYAGVYEKVNPHSKLNVLAVLVFSVVVTIVLGMDFFSVPVNLIRRLPRVVLEKINGQRKE